MDKHRHITCTGERCELCDEMFTTSDLVQIEQLRLCPVCRMKLGVVLTHHKGYYVTSTS